MCWEGLVWLGHFKHSGWQQRAGETAHFWCDSHGRTVLVNLSIVKSEINGKTKLKYLSAPMTHDYHVCPSHDNCSTSARSYASQHTETKSCKYSHFPHPGFDVNQVE